MRVVALLLAAAAAATATPLDHLMTFDEGVKAVKAFEKWHSKQIVAEAKHMKPGAAAAAARQHAMAAEATLSGEWRELLGAARRMSVEVASPELPSLDAARRLMQDDDTDGFGDPGDFSHPMHPPLECYTATFELKDTPCCNKYAEVEAALKSECPGLVKDIATNMRAISRADSAAARASARAATNANITTLCGATCYTNAVAAFKTVSSQSGVGCPKISYSITYLEDFMCATAGTGGDRCLVLDQDPATSGVFDGNDDLSTVTAADATKACACASAARTRFDAEAKYLAASNWALVASTNNMAVSARAQRAIGFALGAEARIRSKTVEWACST
ncbi:unnamed protein product, partial [Symbiodinium sp. KB8]